MLHVNDLAAVAFPTATPWLLLEGALEGAAVLAVGTVCALIARGASAAVRHMIWTLTLTGAFVAPVVGALLPQWHVPVPGWEAMDEAETADAAAMTKSYTAPTDSPALAEPSTAIASITTGRSSMVTISVDGIRGVAAIVAGEPSFAAEAVNVAERAPAALADRHPGGWVVPLRGDAATLGGRLAKWFVAAWLLGVVLTLTPTLFGMARVSALLRRAHPMRGGRWALLAPSAIREIDVRRRVRFVELDEPVMPMTAGIFRPVVLLPVGDFDSSIPQRLDVLRHELAHVRRHDCLTQLIAQIACALNWFNPLAWIAAREMRIERERACDDEVLCAGAKASDYADYLMRVARETRMSGVAAFGGLAMARPSQLAVRLRAVLDDGRRRDRVSTAMAVMAAVAAAFLAAAIGAMAPSPAEARPAVAVPQAVAIVSANRGFGRAGVSLEALSAPAAVAHPDAVVLPPPAIPDMAALPAVVSSVSPAGVELIAAQGVAPCDPNARTRGKSNHTNWMSSDNGSKRWRVIWSDDDCSFEVEARGEIRYNSDVTDIESISAGGSFMLEQRAGDDTRRLTVRPRSDGTLDRAYAVNGDRREYDQAARAWFAEALVALDRRTAFAADQRVPALLQSGGVDAVLGEISLMVGDYAQRRYYTKLLALRQLDQAQVRRVVEQAGADMSSDYELAELLVAVSGRDAFGDDSHMAFVGAVKKIDSDYERRRALNALLKRDRLAPATVESLLDAASTIGSDYELAELLIDVSKRYAIDDRTRPVYLKAVRSIESDYEHRRVLSAIIAGGGLTSDVARALLEDARRIQSDYELAEFLIAISGKAVLGAATHDAYFAAVDKIKSDYEHRRALTRLIQRDVLTRDIAKGILASAARIDSDYECAELLVALANAITIDDDLRPAFDRAADTIQGEHEYGRAMSAVRRRATR